MRTFWQRFMFPMIGGILGIILAVLFISLGFFKTLLVIILAIVGMIIGFYLQQSDIFQQLLKHTDNH
ncbi:DUF2273 domain-containing protein [Lapidilactobacillus gannanensis]|uniref:DUF2273 domain-containing protein n=1 Tax=Lapidilactobacillus gannanensis TaxID=2486002 RepID=A0ABW4BM17_9LACO|nr:DUF2273 domain-containing protein [Lapidilactobacillus gannanensis]